MTGSPDLKNPPQKLPVLPKGLESPCTTTARIPATTSLQPVNAVPLPGTGKMSAPTSKTSSATKRTGAHPAIATPTTGNWVCPNPHLACAVQGQGKSQHPHNGRCCKKDWSPTCQNTPPSNASDAVILNISLADTAATVRKGVKRGWPQQCHQQSSAAKRAEAPCKCHNCHSQAHNALAQCT